MAEQAETLIRRALALYEKSLGADDLMTAGCLRLSARVARARNQYDEAERLARRSLSIIEKRWLAPSTPMRRMPCKSWRKP